MGEKEEDQTRTMLIQVEFLNQRWEMMNLANNEDEVHGTLLEVLQTLKDRLTPELVKDLVWLGIEILPPGMEPQMPSGREE